MFIGSCVQVDGYLVAIRHEAMLGNAKSQWLSVIPSSSNFKWVVTPPVHLFAPETRSRAACWILVFGVSIGSLSFHFLCDPFQHLIVGLWASKQIITTFLTRTRTQHTHIRTPIPTHRHLFTPSRQRIPIQYTPKLSLRHIVMPCDRQTWAAK